MATGGSATTSVRKPPKPMTDKELDNISPAARRAMEQKRRDMKQEKDQKNMESSVRGKKMAKGGGVESKGKTKGKMVKMAEGGMVGKASKRADGIASRGKTKCKVM